MREVYTRCLKVGKFPKEWKEAELVLIPKEGKHVETPAAFRPIRLIDEAGKILERILAGRINRHLEEEGPNLDLNQYGFRAGRSTIDAVKRVRE